MGTTWIKKHLKEDEPLKTDRIFSTKTLGGERISENEPFSSNQWAQLEFKKHSKEDKALKTTSIFSAKTLEGERIS